MKNDSSDKNKQGDTTPQDDFAKIKDWFVRNNKPVILIAALILLDAYFFNIFIGEGKPTLASVVALVISVVTLYFFHLRIRNQDRQLEKQSQQIGIQIRKEIDDRFNAAINLLNSNETSARTGAIFSLYQLAIEDEKYRKQTAQILCSHIRSKTQEGTYQTDHAARPSNEIQTTIDLLFKDSTTHLITGNNNPEGLYAYCNFRTQLSSASLMHAYLVGADFSRSNCQRIDFTHANCMGASFFESFCEIADFSNAACQAVDFTQSRCQGTYFHHANCQGANFNHAECQGISFREADCQGADFESMNCQGGNFSYAKCQGADFSRVECQGAHTEHYGTILSQRIGQNTEFNTIVFSGQIDIESIEKIEQAKDFLPEEWHQRMQKIIEDNKGKPISHKRPEFDDIKVGELTNTDELEEILNRLKEIKNIDRELNLKRFKQNL